MKALSLYDMTSEMLELLEAEEVDMEMLETAFGALASKDNRICHFIRDVEAFALTCKSEETRLSNKRKALENKVERLKNLIQLSMDRLGMDHLEAGTFKLSVQDNPPALETIDRELTPARFRIVIPATWVEDKAKIKEALKIGEIIPGYALKRGRSLRIR